jgi:metal-responsive CopG/Arc/MetJ family transcriptional regulator
MTKCAKVAISLPEDVLQAVETERKARRESRSQYFRRAIEKLLKQERDSSAVKDYVTGYQKYPEMAEEIEAVHLMGTAVLAEEPWE